MGDERTYYCPKCSVGELYDMGGMFIAQIRCTNPDCDYQDDDTFCDLTTSE